jgi:rod shape-determining protein MreC
MEHQPPPFFKRGPAPLALLTLYVAISISLLVVDARFKYLDLVRQGVSIVTYPLQRFAQMPARSLEEAASYFGSVADLQNENRELKGRQLQTAPSLQRLQHLEAENTNLRKLLDVKERQKAGGSAARIIYAARDPFSRRVVVDRGQQDGIAAGQPVIDEVGVVGQVTRVYPFVAEVTLITDKDQSVPVEIVRNGLRSVVSGLGGGQLELRFMPANADVQVGDMLVTSGLDGIYQPGFPVARVAQIDRDAAYSFARILCVPVAGVENRDTVLLLKPRAAEGPRPDSIDEPAPDAAGDKAGKQRKRKVRP